MKLKRVVVTGLGALTPLGNDVPTMWDAMLKGVSGADSITRFDASKFKTQFACEIKGYDAQNYFDRKDARKYDPYTQYGLIVAEQAIVDSGLNLEKIDLDRAGVIWGSGIGGLGTFFDEVTGFAKGDGTPRFNPFFIPKMIADICAGLISIRFGFRGINFATVSACASSANAIVDAFNYIRLGKMDVCITGGSEAAVNEAGIGGFNAMHALSTRNDDPKTASRPFDVDRDGFVLGEGGGGLVLEEYEHAKARGAKIYAEIVGCGMTADANHITAPHPEGLGARNSMRLAVEDAEIALTDIEHINTHGTSTPAGDLAEPQAIVSLFGAHTPNIFVNSTKSMTGHLLGAAGAIECIASIKSVIHGVIPPTINQFNLDPQLDATINFVFNQKVEKELTYAISNTFGFGGHNVSIIVKKFVD